MDMHELVKEALWGFGKPKPIMAKSQPASLPMFGKRTLDNTMRNFAFNNPKALAMIRNRDFEGLTKEWAKYKEQAFKRLQLPERHKALVEAHIPKDPRNFAAEVLKRHREVKFNPNLAPRIQPSLGTKIKSYAVPVIGGGALVGAGALGIRAISRRAAPLQEMPESEDYYYA
jgi:hypothetical protein